MEHGWIPGTIQFDKYWADEFYKYSSEPEIDLETNNRGQRIRQITEYIIQSKIDTGKYRETEADNRSLQRIDKSKKTVFFAGMDDYGMGINSKSIYWKKNVMSVFSSTDEAAIFIAEICKKNNWNFVFKPHPNSTSKCNIDKIYNSIIRVNYTKIDELIQIADVVISVASKVEYITLLHKKPLIKLGFITLYKKGCCYEIKDRSQIESQLKKAIEQGMTVEQNRIFESHIAQLLSYHLWDDLTERKLRYGLPLDIDFFKER